MVKPRKPTPIAMAKFFLSVGNYRQACREIWNSLWAWVPITFVAGLAIPFGYSAMTEGKYILAVILYAVGVGAAGAKAIHDYRTHPLRRQLTVIIASVTVLILAGLITWTVYEGRKTRQKLQEQSKERDQEKQEKAETNKKLEETQRQLDEMRRDDQRRHDEITKMLKEQNPQATPKKLLEKYSHGYLIGKLNQRSPATPYDSQRFEGYQINWDVAGVTDLGNSVRIRLPDIVSVGSGVAGTTVTLPKKPGASKDVLSFENLSVIVEVLALAPDGGVVVVIGLRS